MLKVAVVAPIASARVVSATTVNAGVRRIPRTEYRMSRPTMFNNGNVWRIIPTEDGLKLGASRQPVKPTDAGRVTAIPRKGVGPLPKYRPQGIVGRMEHARDRSTVVGSPV